MAQISATPSPNLSTFVMAAQHTVRGDYGAAGGAILNASDPVAAVNVQKSGLRFWRLLRPVMRTVGVTGEQVPILGALVALGIGALEVSGVGLKMLVGRASFRQFTYTMAAASVETVGSLGGFTTFAFGQIARQAIVQAGRKKGVLIDDAAAVALFKDIGSLFRANSADITAPVQRAAPPVTYAAKAATREQAQQPALAPQPPEKPRTTATPGMAGPAPRG